MSQPNITIKSKSFIITWSDDTTTSFDAKTSLLEIRDTYMTVTAANGRLSVIPYTNIKRIAIS